jgi:hypothetical protein
VSSEKKRKGLKNTVFHNFIISEFQNIHLGAAGVIIVDEPSAVDRIPLAPGAGPEYDDVVRIPVLMVVASFWNGAFGEELSSTSVIKFGLLKDEGAFQRPVGGG